MNAPAKPAFGFSGLDDFQPSPREVRATPLAPRAVDQAGERHGFASREALVRRRRQKVEEPTDQINIRAGIADINTFVGWCEKERLSYREGFAELVKLIGMVSVSEGRR